MVLPDTPDTRPLAEIQAETAARNSHADAAMFHLTEAADADTGSATEHYHLSAASTRATLASVEVAQRQADAVSAAAQVNARLLALMVQGEPEATAPSVTPEV